MFGSKFGLMLPRPPLIVGAPIIDPVYHSRTHFVSNPDPVPRLTVREGFFTYRLIILKQHVSHTGTMACSWKVWKSPKLPEASRRTSLQERDLRILIACLNSSKLQYVLIYLQFASAAAKASANVMAIPAFTTGGQHGVIAEDWRLRQAAAQEGAPSSKRTLSLFLLLLVLGMLGTAFFQKSLLFNS